LNQPIEDSHAHDFIIFLSAPGRRWLVLSHLSAKSVQLVSAITAELTGGVYGIKICKKLNPEPLRGTLRTARRRLY